MWIDLCDGSNNNDSTDFTNALHTHSTYMFILSFQCYSCFCFSFRFHRMHPHCVVLLYWSKYKITGSHNSSVCVCVCVHLCDLFHLFVMQIFCRKLILLLEIYKYIWIRIRKRSSCALFLPLSDISTLYLTRTSGDANQIIVTKYNLPNKNVSKQEWTRADK